MAFSAKSFLIDNAISIVANGVIRKYGLSLRDSKDDVLWFYKSGDSTALVSVNQPASTKDFDFNYEKFDYLCRYLEELNFDTKPYGGVYDALVWISHPQQFEMVQKITSLSRELRELKLEPRIDSIAIDNNGKKFYGRGCTIGVWVNNFYREFSESFPKTSLEKRFPL